MVTTIISIRTVVHTTKQRTSANMASLAVIPSSGNLLDDLAEHTMRSPVFQESGLGILLLRYRVTGSTILMIM